MRRARKKKWIKQLIQIWNASQPLSHQLVPSVSSSSSTDTSSTSTINLVNQVVVDAIPNHGQNRDCHPLDPYYNNKDDEEELDLPNTTVMISSSSSSCSSITGTECSDSWEGNDNYNKMNRDQEPYHLACIEPRMLLASSSLQRSNPTLVTPSYHTRSTVVVGGLYSKSRDHPIRPNDPTTKDHRTYASSNCNWIHAIKTNPSCYSELDPYSHHHHRHAMNSHDQQYNNADPTDSVLDDDWDNTSRSCCLDDIEYYNDIQYSQFMSHERNDDFFFGTTPILRLPTQRFPRNIMYNNHHHNWKKYHGGNSIILPSCPPRRSCCSSSFLDRQPMMHPTDLSSWYNSSTDNDQYGCHNTKMDHNNNRNDMVSLLFHRYQAYQNCGNDRSDESSSSWNNMTTPKNTMIPRNNNYNNMVQNANYSWNVWD
jgi:hypothetical protein